MFCGIKGVYGLLGSEAFAPAKMTMYGRNSKVNRIHGKGVKSWLNVLILFSPSSARWMIAFPVDPSSHTLILSPKIPPSGSSPASKGTPISSTPFTGPHNSFLTLSPSTPCPTAASRSTRAPALAAARAWFAPFPPRRLEKLSAEIVWPGRTMVGRS